VVLGSTGSIGVNTLAVVEHLTRSGQRPLDVVGLAAGGNARLLEQQADRFDCSAVALADPPAGWQANQTNRDTLVGEDAAERLIQQTEPDLVVAAIVGIAGLPATVAAIRRGCTVALANKETLVAAGSLVMPLARRCGATLLPVDSEHSAIFQCLAGQSPCEHAESSSPRNAATEPGSELRVAAAGHRVRRIVLTASGGPFRTAPLDVMRDATPDQALNHPTWDMGPKISIDSATMMNKALEIIEAHHLFGLPAEKIDVLIHPQSVVHGMVEFADHSVLAQLGPPDMRTPIQVALTGPTRTAGCSDRLDWTRLSQLDFAPPDGDRFPAVGLAYDVIRSGGDGSAGGAIFNAANEAAVAAFLERRIRFGRIVELVAEALDRVQPPPVSDLTDIYAADAEARQYIARAVAGPDSPSP
jgi:1-deoxy-D-xylulose-5-phosphate reductoisomerase